MKLGAGHQQQLAPENQDRQHMLDQPRGSFSDSELFPAILDWIITEKQSKRMSLIIFRAHYRKHPAIHRSDDTRTEIPWTKSCKELRDENTLPGKVNQLPAQPKLLQKDLFKYHF